MPDSQTLKILLLGAPTIYYNDRPLQIQRRLMRWMLFYLASQRDMVGRSDLILLFWPDENEEDARRHLRETLSKLRTQLPDPNWIITEQDKVGLDFKHIYSDVLEFQALFGQVARACAQTPASSPLTQAVYEKVARAVRLWRSGRFLAGAPAPDSEAVADWLLQTSQEVEINRQRLLERLADHDASNGDAEGAIHWLRMALESDEINESLHYRILVLLQKQGRFSEASNYGAYLQELFQREGYEDLPPSLLNLCKAIREEATRPAAGENSRNWPDPSKMQTPFVGRENIRKDLVFAINRGEPAIILGEGGSGKSRLVQETFPLIAPARRLLLAPARALEYSLPYQPLVDMLRREIQAEEWKKLDVMWVASLALLLPELSTIRPEISTLKLPSEQTHSLLFEALRKLFMFLRERQRFLLFIDNAQWCDPSTLAVLSYLLERHLFGESSAIILAARPEEINAHLENFLTQRQSEGSIRCIPLPQLEREDLAQIAHFVLGEQYKLDLVERLEKETGGNPFFLLETLRLVLDYTLSPQLHSDVDHLPLSRGVHAMISERVKHLAPNDSQVMSAAAVLGSTFPIDLLEQTSQLPGEQVAQSLERLEKLNLVKAGSPEVNQYTFVHDKVREVVLLDLSPVRKRLLHLRVARSLEQKQQGHSEAIEAVLAFHYDEAGETANAFQHWFNAANYAWRVYAKTEANRAFHRAEQALQRLGQSTTSQPIYQLYRQWAHMAFDLNDPERIKLSGQALLQFGQIRQDPLLVGVAYTIMAQAAELYHHPEEGLQIVEKALPYLEKSGNLLEHVEVLYRQGIFFMMQGRYVEAEQAYEQALKINIDASDPTVFEARAHTAYRLGVIQLANGCPRRAHELAGQSMMDAGKGFNQVAELQATSLLALAKGYLGQYSQSMEIILKTLDQASTVPIPILVADLLGSAALTSLAVGQLDRCWTYARQALRITEDNNSTYLREGMYTVLGDLYFFLGDYTQAETMFSQGSEAELGNFHALNNLTQLGLALAVQGQVEAGLAHIERVLNYLGNKSADFFALQARLAIASIYSISDREEDAATILETLEADAGQRGLIEITLKSCLVRSRMALAQGHLNEAMEIARATASGAQSAGHLLIETQARALWVDAARMGDMTVPSALVQRLRDCINYVQENTKIPELRERLTKKMWTKTFKFL